MAMTEVRDIREGIEAGMAIELGSAAHDAHRDLLMGNREPSCGFELGLVCGRGAASVIEGWARVGEYKERFRREQVEAVRRDLRCALEAAEVARATLLAWGESE